MERIYEFKCNVNEAANPYIKILNDYPNEASQTNYTADKFCVNLFTVCNHDDSISYQAYRLKDFYRYQLQIRFSRQFALNKIRFHTFLDIIEILIMPTSKGSKVCWQNIDQDTFFF